MPGARGIYGRTRTADKLRGMYRKKVFWQLFGTYGVLILASIFILGFLLQSQARLQYTTDIENELKRIALLTESLLQSDRAKDLGSLLEQLHTLSPSLPIRLALFDRDGRRTAAF